MVVMEDVTEEERSAELYVSWQLRSHVSEEGGGGVIPFSDKISKVVFGFWFVCFRTHIYVRITLSRFEQ